MVPGIPENMVDLLGQWDDYQRSTEDDSEDAAYTQVSLYPLLDLVPASELNQAKTIQKRKYTLLLRMSFQSAPKLTTLFNQISCQRSSLFLNFFEPY